ncbi:ABC transporter substrate-binding protein [Pseudoclavibacter sp. CFCC 11306]|uniref:ABC transporter substrate-binding protein n=1 Tax=Pseudoclavibacter sp. CFCC 11306 TaxID=1564493 RepID=UPI0013012E69|nr:ABC transporter substrate-binding protein [Pseudoclavibacter sp. CFCC 11306]KAB1658868.1 ABC transporter substrate-binding protein [Pseudoclavibacter sp. CFCC 11306]
MQFSRRIILAAGLAGALSLTLTACSGGGDTTDASGSGRVTIAEPIHSIGYLPLYAAISTGAFSDAGIDVTVTTLTGGAHVNAVLNNSAWGFIGGPESGAIANSKGADLVAIGGVVNRANIYWAASPSSGVHESDLAQSLRGKRIAVGRHGGSPEVLTFFELRKLGLDPDKDVQIVNNDVSGSELSLVSANQADVAVTTEPVLGQGIEQGIWGQPVLNVPQSLGEYPYSAIVTSRANADKSPEFTRKFLAALGKGIDLVRNDPEQAKAIAVKEFPSLTPEVIQNTLDRAYSDDLWTGLAISTEAEALNLDVARQSGLLVDDGKNTPESVLKLDYLP